MADLEGRRVVQMLDRLLHRLDDLFPAMPGVAAPEARRAVQDLAPVDTAIVHALGGSQQEGVPLELAVPGKGHPEGFQIIRPSIEVDGNCGSVTCCRSCNGNVA